MIEIKIIIKHSVFLFKISVGFTFIVVNPKFMAGSALKRFMSEYKQLTLNPPEGIVSGPIDEENFFKWGVLIGGPEGTPFGGGVFTARLSFPMDYPLNPPKMKFISDIFHPNNEEPRSIDYSSEESTKRSSQMTRFLNDRE